MDADLGELLDAVVADERMAFDMEHPSDDSALYSTVISPLRRVRRLAPLGALAAAGLVGLGVLALGIGRAGEAAPVAASSTTASSPTTAALGDPDAVAGEAGWTVEGRVIDPYASASPVIAAVGPVIGEPVACGALEAFGRLVGRADGTVAVHLGAFVEPGGGATEVHVRTFATADDAADYLGELWRIAGRCADELAPWGVDAAVARVALTGAPGEAVVVTVPVAFADAAWRLWVYVDGAAALAVMADPEAADLAAAITLDWVGGGLR